MKRGDRRTGGQPDGKTTNRKNPPSVLGGFTASEERSDGPSVRLSDLPVEFVGTFPDPATPLEPRLPEIAFVGRSNVGKSSLINAVTGRAGLARTSGAPGKTRALNVFRMPEFYLVDLPGYGYAKASKATRAEIRSMLDRYIMRRPHVAGIVWLLDIRRDPSPDDERLYQQFAARHHPFLTVLTKADKLGRSDQAKRGRELARSLGLAEDQVQATSCSTGLGIADLGDSILGLVDSLRDSKMDRRGKSSAGEP